MPWPILAALTPATIAKISAAVSAASIAANSGMNLYQQNQIRKNKAMAARNRGEIVRWDKYRKRYYTYK